MDIHSNLEYLCRVCAANTKGKNSVAECVYILKTAGLKDKLDKYLYLKISDNDSLPKVLCKTCFRQVEATAALSKIAKHTQQVFREFLLSNLPKGPSESTNTSIDYTTSDYATKKDANEKSKKEEISIPSLPANTLAQLLPPQIPASVAAMLPPPLVQPLNITPRKDEVIVNVSVSDPLTRDNQQKMISNSQRRQSLLLESRYTPKSIAQKSSTMASASAVVNQKVVAPKLNATVETANTTNLAKNNATPTLNFYPINKTQQPTKQQQQQLTQNTQITTFSSGGYVIGRINDKEEPKKTTLPLAPTADNVLQQKRKNLVKALNNIKANNSGQVSLLKSSQQKQANASSSLAKVPLTEVVNQAAEDELPEKIIIAAPKNKSGEKSKKEPLNLSSKIPAVVTAVTPAPLPNTPATITPIVQQQQIPEQTQAANFNNTPPKPAFPEDILLGRVIRDMDLLKLILKALKWPVNKQNMELQLQRLKNSKFTDIMSDSNLLQDTDLTQLLGPYLAPVLLAAQALQQQQQQILKNAALNQTIAAPAYIPQPAPPAQPKISALEAAQAEINKSIPYKLPPETSVQLVPATPEEQEAVQSPPLPNITTTTATSILKRDRQKETPAAAEVPQKRQRRAAAQRARDSIVISDEEDVEEEVPKSRSRQRSNKNNSNIQIELNSNFMAQFNLLTGSNSDEANAALLALLQRQKDALLKDKKVQRRRRNSVSNLITLPNNEFDALIDLDDDIVLMEPVSTTSSSESVPAASNSQEISPVKQPDISNPFIIPSAPLITRPIIKRRKTVIHSSRGRLDSSLDKDATAISSSALAANKEKLMEETINQVAKGNMISDTTNNEVVAVPTQPSSTKATNNNESSPLPTTEVSNTKTATQQKKTQNKSALGQQLLEAIGLQKISTKISNNTQTETATSSTITNNMAPMPNSKQSIQQIRSALKKSLKQAQEQQQQRKKELSSSSTNNTIIQDADSTTKPAVKEIVVVEGKGNKTDDNSSSMVDVEEQIDKVTLMVRKNDEKDVNEQPTTSEKEEKKEKKSPNTKIQERRRTMPALGARGARNAAANDAKDKSNNEEEKEMEEKEPEKTKKEEENNEKPEKEEADNANISSSSVATSSETSATNKEEVVTPKRRGRKRLVDKQAEAETTEANESEKDKESDNKEKDNKSSTAITERSRTTDKTKEEETDNNKNDEEQETTTSNKTSGRPTRQSKQQSKYYKGPEKPAVGRRSLPSRTTRNRKYS